MDRTKATRLDAAARIIAHMLYLMGTATVACDTFDGLSSSSMKEMVKGYLYKISGRTAAIFTQ